MKKFLLLGGSPGKEKKLLARLNFLEKKAPNSVYLYNSRLHNQLKQDSQRFFQSYTGSLALADVKPAQDLAKKIGLALIGADLGQDFDAKKALLGLINLEIPLILEDDALVPELLKIYNPNKNLWLLVLDKNQFELLVKEDATDDNLNKFANKYQISFYCDGKYFASKINNYFTILQTFVGDQKVVSAQIAYYLRSW